VSCAPSAGDHPNRRDSPGGMARCLPPRGAPTRGPAPYGGRRHAPGHPHLLPVRLRYGHNLRISRLRLGCRCCCGGSTVRPALGRLILTCAGKAFVNVNRAGSARAGRLRPLELRIGHGSENAVSSGRGTRILSTSAGARPSTVALSCRTVTETGQNRRTKLG